MNPEDLPLRDIHLPAPVAVWPLAPGWWAVAGLAVLALALAVWGWWRWRNRAQVRAARALLRALALQVQNDGLSQGLVSEVAVTVRRVMVHFLGRDRVARLEGQRWLEFLSRQTGEPGFADGPGAWLAEAPYRPAASLDRQRVVWVLDVIDRWVAAEGRS